MAIDPIGHALGPGIAVTSVIFFNAGLLGRFTYVTGRIRELNREARELRRQPAGAAEHERLASIRAQVDVLTERARTIRTTIVLAYASLVLFIVSILLLLLWSAMGISGPSVVPIVPFATGLGTFAIGASRATSEVASSYRTVEEDIRSSLSEET